MKHFLTGILIAIGFFLAALTFVVWFPFWGLYRLGKSFNEYDPNEVRYPWL